MQIKKDILKDYLLKITANKEIPNGHLNFTADGVKSTMINLPNSLLTDGILEKKAFQNYEAIGQVYLKEIFKIINFLDTFKDLVELKVENNVLKIYNESRDVKFILGEKESCQCVFEKQFPNDLQWNAKFTITKDFLGVSTMDMKSLKVIKMVFSCEDGLLNINVGESNFDNTKNKLKIETKEKAETKLGELMINIQEAMSNQVMVHLGTDIPMKIEDNSEFVKVKTVIAPRIENEEQA